MRDAELIALLTHTSGAATRTGSATATAAATTTTTLKRERSNSGSGSARSPSPTRSRHATTTTTTTRARSRDDKGNHGSTKTRGSGSTSTPCARRVSVNWCTVAALLYGTTRRRLYTPARVRAVYTRLLRSDAYAGDEAALRRDTLAQAAAMRPSRCSNDNNTDDADESDDDDYTLPRPLTSMHAELSFMANSAAAAVSSPTRTHTHGSKKDDDDDNDGEQQKKTTKTTTTAGHGNNDTAHVTSEHHHHHNNNSNSNSNKDDEDADEDEVARWLRRLLPDVRAHARLLWYEVALRHEVLSALLQQFFCVDGAEVFFAPVPANTIMEYNGVRLATYHSVVRVPMSLMAIKKCISDSRRDYHALTRAAALTTQQRGQRRGDHDNNEDDDTTSDSMSSDVAYNNNNNNTTMTVSLCRSSHMDRIVTLAELHRDVWLIAANCVMFNAPETNYPYTARRFARACTRLLIDYADKQLGDTAPLVRA